MALSKTLFKVSFLGFCLISFCFSAQAKPLYRGFQIGIETLTSAEILSLRDKYNANIVRIQVGNDFLMDGTTGAAYDAMMEESLDYIDTLLPELNAAGVKVVFSLYSPPGGFTTREAPSHYAMFSDAALQADFIEMWETIALRYLNSDLVYAYDLVNEPALRQSLKSADTDDWPTLAADTVAAIRSIDADRQIYVKSLYGDPTKLKNLPVFSDDNLCYSFHAYPDPKYIGQGVDQGNVKKGPPSAKRIERTTIKPLFRLVKKYPKAERKNVCFNVGEFAVSRFAPKADKYLRNLMRLFERGRILNKRTGKAQRVDIQGYTYHAFDEAPFWDPRSSDNPNEDGFSSTLTKRERALIKFFRRNR